MATGQSTLGRGYLMGVASAAVLSTTAVLIRHLTETYHAPPLVLALWRDVFVVLTLVLVLGWLRPARLRVARSHWLYLTGYGLVLAVFNSLWTVSVALNGAAVATVLVYCSAGFTVLLGWWLLGEGLGWTKLGAVILSLGGCLLVSDALDSSAWRVNWPGIATGVLSGLSYAAYSLMGRSAHQRGLNPWTTLLYTFALATVFLLIANLGGAGILPGTAPEPADLFWFGRAWAGWAVLLILAAGPTVIGFGLYNITLTHLPSSVANLIVTLEPPFTAVTAYFALGERLTAVQLWGGLLTLAGVAVLRLHGSGGPVGSRPARAVAVAPVAGDERPEGPDSVMTPTDADLPFLPRSDQSLPRVDHPRIS